MSPTLEAQRRRTKMALAIAASAIFISLLGSGAALIQRFDATTQARANNAHVWHAVICSIEQAVLKSKRGTYAEKVEELRFYDSLLTSNVKTAPCGLTVPHGR